MYGQRTISCECWYYILGGYRDGCGLLSYLILLILRNNVYCHHYYYYYHHHQLLLSNHISEVHELWSDHSLGNVRPAVMY